MFYVFCDVDSKGAFWVMDDDGLPVSYGTEAEAVAVAKEYSATSIIVKAVARVTERTTYKVEKIK